MSGDTPMAYTPSIRFMMVWLYTTVVRALLRIAVVSTSRGTLVGWLAWSLVLLRLVLVVGLAPTPALMVTPLTL